MCYTLPNIDQLTFSLGREGHERGPILGSEGLYNIQATLVKDPVRVL